MEYYHTRFAFAIIGLVLTTAALGQKPYTLKSYKMTVSGTSTLHDWTSDVTKLEWTGSILTEGDKVKAIKDVTVTIPVKMIKSEKGGMMDDKTYEAFNSDKNPNIVFKLNAATVVDGGLNASGTLTMAGSPKSIQMRPEIKVHADGSIQVKGSYPLNMKDYKMIPPKAMMGTIKVAPEITVNYDLILIP